MLEHMKKQCTTGYVNFTFRIPRDRADEIQKMLVSLGAEDVKDSIAWEEVFPEFNPSVALRGARKREGLTQIELANLIGIKQIHISKMENNKRSIGKEMAKQFANVLHIDYRVFLKE
ncbi:MAG: helix-turn-helix transcriptional regulator [Thermodesulfobacteriota bacterium]|nr:helix-turn-helix transcriptional regulator [Thermodesulfobacteriota bacterium]